MPVVIRYEQAVYGSFPFWDKGYAILARSPGCRDEWLADLKAACQRYGERPAARGRGRGPDGDEAPERPVGDRPPLPAGVRRPRAARRPGLPRPLPLRERLPQGRGLPLRIRNVPAHRLDARHFAPLGIADARHAPRYVDPATETERPGSRRPCSAAVASRSNPTGRSTTSPGPSGSPCPSAAAPGSAWRPGPMPTATATTSPPCPAWRASPWIRRTSTPRPSATRATRSRTASPRSRSSA